MIDSSRRVEELPAGSERRKGLFTRFSILAMAAGSRQIPESRHLRCCW